MKLTEIHPKVKAAGIVGVLLGAATAGAHLFGIEPNATAELVVNALGPAVAGYLKSGDPKPLEAAVAEVATDLRIDVTPLLDAVAEELSSRLSFALKSAGVASPEAPEKIGQHSLRAPLV